MIRKVLLHSRFWQGIALLCIDSLYFGLTNPGRVVAGGLIAGFLLLAITLYYLFTGVLAAARLYGISLGPQRKRLALFATAVAGGLLAMQSMGQLSIRDMLVVGPLAIMLYIYLGYGRSGRTSSPSL